MIPRTVKDFNVFGNGNDYRGKVTEIVLPDLAIATEEYKAAGIGPVDLDMGLEKLTAKITMPSMERGLFSSFGEATIDGVALRFLGSVESDSSAGADSAEIVMRGRFTKITGGTIKKGDQHTIEYESSLTYYKYILNGEVLIEIDMINMIFVVDGDDRWKARRNALAL